MNPSGVEQISETSAEQICYWIEKAREGTASEQQQERLANWLLETCLYYATLESAAEPQEIAVLTAERLWEAVRNGKLRWQEEVGLKGILAYIRRAVRYEIGRAQRNLVHDHAVIIPLDDARDTPAPDDIETEVVETLMWRPILEAVRKAIPTLSPQQQLIVQLHLEGLEPREIAETLNISRPQVNVVLSQVRARLRRYLLEQAQNDPALAESLRQVLNIQMSEGSDEG